MWGSRVPRSAVRDSFADARFLGQPVSNPESRFLQEIPQHLLDWRRTEPKRSARREWGSSGGVFLAILSGRAGGVARRPGRRIRPVVAAVAAW